MRRIVPIALFMMAAAGPAVAQTQWWEAETAMDANGGLRLDDKSWWTQAQALKVGESFELKSEKGDGAMLVRREKAVNPTYGETIVWILDDDGDFADGGPDKDSDCYVADHNADGVVDQMVDWIDENGDDVPEAMDIRYFIDGQLRYNWASFDNDGDGHMWHVVDYRYRPPFFYSDAYGDAMIFLNKFNPIDGTWYPFSECPFWFHDTDGDGASERVVRVSAVPFALLGDPEHPDPANDYRLIGGEEWDKIGAVNVRYSFDIDGEANENRKLHYEMGFNMIGKQPYEYEGMEHHSDKRRAPKTMTVMPFDKVGELSDEYPTESTGFTFMEFEDATIAIGHDDLNPPDDRRWEGVFWTWHRRIMHNTGGPTQVWNIRREYDPKPSDRRSVYYSPADMRLHLKGATEGWIRIGMIGTKDQLGETVMRDTDGDGYFDRWEHYAFGETDPFRVDTFNNVENVDLGDDWEKIEALYKEKVAEAVALQESFSQAADRLPAAWKAELPAGLTEAMGRQGLSATERRYLLEQANTLAWRAVHTKALDAARRGLEGMGQQSTRSREENAWSEKAWALQNLVAELDAVFAGGELAKAGELAARVVEAADGLGAKPVPIPQ